MHYVYRLLVAVTKSCGLYSEALRYGLLALKSAKSDNRGSDLSHYLATLGRVCEDLGDLSKAIGYYKQGVTGSLEGKDDLAAWQEPGLWSGSCQSKAR
jgi:tetratricopeptide (TPR) repeat protein